MMVLGFVEGANMRAGYLGLVAVPRILYHPARRGHQAVSFVAGGVSPGGDLLVQPDIDSVTPEGGLGTFSVVTRPVTVAGALPQPCRGC